MKLTKRQALEICRDLWDWLAANPDSHKEDWPGWTSLRPFAHDCPCCERVLRELGRPEDDDYMHCTSPEGGSETQDKVRVEMLDLCPLKSLWPNGCCNLPSPFIQWATYRHDPSRREQCARAIADACRKELEAMPA